MRRIELLLGDDSDGPGERQFSQLLPEFSADTVAGVGKDGAEPHSCLPETLQLVDGDAPLRPERYVSRNTGLFALLPILSPRLRQVELQRERDRHVIAGER